MVVTVDELIRYTTSDWAAKEERQRMGMAIVNEETIQRRGDESCT